MVTRSRQDLLAAEWERLQGAGLRGQSVPRLRKSFKPPDGYAEGQQGGREIEEVPSLYPALSRCSVNINCSTD